jgi:hypothetical protein
MHTLEQGRRGYKKMQRHQGRDTVDVSGLKGRDQRRDFVHGYVEPFACALQNENHEVTGPEHEPQTQNIGE